MTLEALARPIVVVGRCGRVEAAGWIAPAQVRPEGVQPARCFLAAEEGAVSVGDEVHDGATVHVVSSASYWHPGDWELSLASEVLADRCRIDRKTGETYDREGNVIVDTRITLWTGPCDVQSSSDATATVVDAAGDATVLGRFVASVPASVVDVAPGDVVVVERSRDSRLIGRPLTVTGVQMSTTPAIRQLLVEDVQ